MISVIIPFLNEEAQLENTIASLKPYFNQIEIIAVDGASQDSSRLILEQYPNIKIIGSPKGRAVQMNAGAKIAQGDILLFLHADTVLGEGWYKALESVDKCFLAGAFSFETDITNPFMFFIKVMVNLRSKFMMHIPYGDQAIWVRRDTFNQVNGYKELVIMEEVDLLDRLKAFTKIKILDIPAYTSIRRWQNEGHLRVTIKNLTALILYRFKVNPEKIRRIYNSKNYPWSKSFKF